MESALNYLGAGNLKGMKVAVQGAGGIGNCFFILLITMMLFLA